VDFDPDPAFSLCAASLLFLLEVFHCGGFLERSSQGEKTEAQNSIAFLECERLFKRLPCFMDPPSPGLGSLWEQMQHPVPGLVGHWLRYNTTGAVILLSAEARTLMREAGRL
jgi:hypothetical protein